MTGVVQHIAQPGTLVPWHAFGRTLQRLASCCCCRRPGPRQHGLGGGVYLLYLPAVVDSVTEPRQAGRQAPQDQLSRVLGDRSRPCTPSHMHGASQLSDRGTSKQIPTKSQTLPPRPQPLIPPISWPVPSPADVPLRLSGRSPLCKPDRTWPNDTHRATASSSRPRHSIVACKAHLGLAACVHPFLIAPHTTTQ